MASRTILREYGRASRLAGKTGSRYASDLAGRCTRRRVDFANDLGNYVYLVSSAVPFHPQSRCRAWDEGDTEIRWSRTAGCGSVVERSAGPGDDDRHSAPVTSTEHLLAFKHLTDLFEYRLQIPFRKPNMAEAVNVRELSTAILQ
jgi:hypothetical protein